MATTAAGAGIAQREARFFFIMACLMAATTVGGFGLMAAMGVSSFAVPWLYHVHAGVFLSWTALYVAQNTLIFRGNIALHRRMGKLAALLIPVMVVLAIWLTFTTLRMLGGPPFFAQAEFLVVNIFHILAFAALAGWALARRRETDWHRRLMFGAMATVGAPGLARLLPLPLTIPYTFAVVFLAAMIFPVVGMIFDKRAHGRVHPAWWWTLAVPIVALVVGEIGANTDAAVQFTAEWVAGTPGGERPAEAFLPPGF
ncbi:hypothetical protein [Erythrobacter litoralis]|uniref:Uncharacterized protein n=1 Tax=Erythrobacter litoralis (strain HTCC2594) TaxID=314225 RepID=Q2NDQ9_ERYLH|nr:hypothetical protein [Erythrobacter litoralis]ABC62182.1 hypothetical protein ELI_00450 [Erythrobacter litoralis HTCC2594]